MMQVIQVRDVNDALEWLVNRSGWKEWRNVSPRGMPTLEHPGPLVTEYLFPTQRVLFAPMRDANPFFHFFEALWILNGDKDVEFLAHFNQGMRRYSDDGVEFHAPYGYRLRKARMVDQILLAIEMLKLDKDTRQVVLQIWECNQDLGARSKDIPCNDMIFLKVRNGELEMSVLCRSNDAIWGAYGANAVQFSTLQEFIAGALKVEVGAYRQISDSFHLYLSTESAGVWDRLQKAHIIANPYRTYNMEPYPLWQDFEGDAAAWLRELGVFMGRARAWLRDEDHARATLDTSVPYLRYVATPMLCAWRVWRDTSVPRPERISAAQNELALYCGAQDWAKAGYEWLERRREL